jgi:hypothetical protein
MFRHLALVFDLRCYIYRVDLSGASRFLKLTSMVFTPMEFTPMVRSIQPIGSGNARGAWSSILLGIARLWAGGRRFP